MEITHIPCLVGSGVLGCFSSVNVCVKGGQQVGHKRLVVAITLVDLIDVYRYCSFSRGWSSPLPSGAIFILLTVAGVGLGPLCRLS